MRNVLCVIYGERLRVKTMKFRSEQWIAIIEDLHRWIGPFSLALVGGEIFVKKGIYDIIKRTVELDISLTILSNGIVFSSDKNIQKLFDTGVRSIAFSLDGMIPEVHDKFRGRKGLHETVTEVIAKIKRLNPEMSVTTTCIVMKETISQLVEYVRWVQDLGVDCVQFQPIAANFGAEEIDLTWYKTRRFFY